MKTFIAGLGLATLLVLGGCGSDDGAKTTPAVAPPDGEVSTLGGAPGSVSQPASGGPATTTGSQVQSGPRAD